MENPKFLRKLPLYLLLMLAILSFGMMGTQTVHAIGSGTATVDGDYGEWNLTEDFFANMYEAGNPEKQLLSKAYLRYDCSTDELFILVLVEDGVTADQSADDAWMKIYDINNSTQVDGDSASFEWLPNNQGYEASFTLTVPPYEYNGVEIHLNATWNGESGRTSSTGKKANPIPLSLDCTPPPEPELDLQLIPDCKDVVNDLYRWRVHNPNDVSVDFTLNRHNNNAEIFSGTATPDGDTVVYTEVSKTTFPTILRVNGVEQEDGRKNPNTNPCEGTIIIEKVVTTAEGSEPAPEDASFDFQVTGEGVDKSFSLMDDGSKAISVVALREYTIEEILGDDAEDWSVSDNCEGTLTPPIWGSETCVFTNEYNAEPPADVRLNLTAECRIGDTLYWRVQGDDTENGVSFDWKVLDSGETGEGMVDAGDRQYFTTTWQPGKANNTRIEWYNPAAGKKGASQKSHNNEECIYHVDFEKEWSGADAPNLTDVVVLEASSSIASAECGYDENGAWYCEYNNPFRAKNDANGPFMIVPFGETYEVEEVAFVPGWKAVEGEGDGFTGIEDFDDEALPDDLVYVVAEDRYCETDSEAEFPENLDKYCTHTVVNEPIELPGVCESLLYVNNIDNTPQSAIYQVALDGSDAVLYEFVDLTGLNDPHMAVNADGSTIYLIESKSPFNLYTYDVASETLTTVGSVGVSHVTLATVGLDGTLYIASGNTNTIYTVDTGTAAITPVVALDLSLNGADMAFDSYGTFYIATRTTGKIYTLDLETGDLAELGKAQMTGMALTANGMGDIMYSHRESNEFRLISRTDGSSLGKFSAVTVTGEDFDLRWGDMASCVVPGLADLTVEKVVEGNYIKDNQTFTMTVTGEGFEEVLTFGANGGMEVIEDLTIGDEFVVSEIVPNGFEADQNNVEITIEPGDDNKVTITNRQVLPPHVDCGENLIQNGDFEAPTISSGKGWDIYPGTAALDWNVEWIEDNVCQDDDPVISPVLELQENGKVLSSVDGNQYAELDSDCQGPVGNTNGGEYPTVEISQLLAVKPGATYTISFYAAERGTAGSDKVYVTFGEQEFEFDISSGWQEFTQTVVAGEEDYVWFTISDRGNPNSYGVLLDAVSVVEECRGAVEVTKDVEVLAGEAPNQSFEICLKPRNGKNDPDLPKLEPECQTVNDGETAVWEDVLAGYYSISEKNPNAGEDWKGWSVSGTGNIEVMPNETMTRTVTNTWLPPEGPQAEVCVALDSFTSGEGVEGDYLGGLIEVSTSNGQTIFVGYNEDPFGWVSNNPVASQNYPGALIDASRIHDYTFTFPDTIIVSEFSVRVWDWGDYNPGKANAWSLQLIGDNGTVDGLMAMGNKLPKSDANADEGQIGNRRYFIEGENLTEVQLNFTCDGGTCTYNASNVGKVEGATSPDPHLGLSELCITYEEANGSLTVVKDAQPDAPWLDWDFAVTADGDPVDTVTLDNDFEDETHSDSKTWEVPTGAYTITETNAPGNWYTQISCGDMEPLAIDEAARSVTVEVPAGEEVICEFTNIRRGQIKITKLNDMNGDGDVSDGEPIADWQMFLYEPADADGEWNQIQPREVRTDENGVANYTNLDEGTYLVCEEAVDRWINTYVSSEAGSMDYDGNICQTVEVADTEVVDVVFGNYKLGRIVAHKYEDINANGEKKNFGDDKEPGIADWPFTVYGPDNLEISKDTGTNGYANFFELPQGEYRVCETVLSGWVNTEPGTPKVDDEVCINVELTTSGQEEWLTFGNHYPTPEESCVINAISVMQGKNSNGGNVPANRSNIEETYTAENSDKNGEMNFFSLGVGLIGEGEMPTTAYVDYEIVGGAIFDEAGADFIVYETSWGPPSFNNYPEEAKVYGKMFANDEWVYLGTVKQGSEEPGIDIADSGLPYISYVRIADNSGGAFAPGKRSGDGFDIDGLSCEPVRPPQDECTYSDNPRDVLSATNIKVTQNEDGTFTATSTVTNESLCPYEVGMAAYHKTHDGWISSVADTQELVDTDPEIADPIDLETVGNYKGEFDGNVYTDDTPVEANIVPPNGSIELSVTFDACKTQVDVVFDASHNIGFNKFKVDEASIADAVPLIIPQFNQNRSDWGGNYGNLYYNGGRLLKWLHLDKFGGETLLPLPECNEEPTGSLTVEKVVEWGEATPDESASFTITVTNSDDYSVELTFPQEDDTPYSETLTDLALGTYNVVEADPGELWTVNGEGDVEVTEEGATATITNTHIDLDYVRIVKYWASPVGLGELPPNGINAMITATSYTSEGDEYDSVSCGYEYEDETPVFSCEDLAVPAGGTYNVSELVSDNTWAPEMGVGEGFTCEQPVDGVCIHEIVNSRVVGDLTVMKVVDWNGAEPSEVSFTITVTGPGPDGDSEELTFPQADDADGDGDPYKTTLLDLEPGEYTVTESDPGELWTVEGEGAVNVAASQMAMATITNTYTVPTYNITIQKSIVPNDEELEEQVYFTGTFTEDVNADAPGDFGMSNLGGLYSFLDVEAGEYTVTELVPEGWMLTGVTCNNEAQEIINGDTVAIDLTTGDVTCTFTNEPIPPEYGSLMVTKVVNWGDAESSAASFEIIVTGPEGYSKTLNFNEAGGSETLNDLEPGDYTITETEPGEMWTVEGNGAVVAVAVNQTATATITNTYVPPVCEPDVRRDLEVLEGISQSSEDQKVWYAVVKNNSDLCTYNIGMASYQKNGSALTDQVLYDSVPEIDVEDDNSIENAEGIPVVPGAEVRIEVEAPHCASQIDLFFDADHLKTYPIFNAEQLDLVPMVLPAFLTNDYGWYGNRYAHRLLKARHINGSAWCNLNVEEDLCPVNMSVLLNEGALVDGETYTVDGTAFIEALFEGELPAKVSFNMESLGEHVEYFGPYFYLGDSAGTPYGWNTDFVTPATYELVVTPYASNDWACDKQAQTFYLTVEEAVVEDVELPENNEEVVELAPLSLTPIADVTAFSSQSLLGTVADTEGEPLTCSVEGLALNVSTGANGECVIEGTLPTVETPTQYNIKVTATSNDGREATTEFKLNVLPNLSNLAGLEGTPFVIPVPSVFIDGVLGTYEFDNLPDGITFDGTNLTGTLPLVDEDTPVEVTVTVALGSSSAQATFTILVQNVEEEITTLETEEVVEPEVTEEPETTGETEEVVEPEVTEEPEIAEPLDSDNDGAADDVDCAINDGTIYPGAAEVANDGIDQDCDGVDLIVDSDGDGAADNVDICEGHNDAIDTDGDGTPDGCDATPTGDTDGDGIDNAADTTPNGDDDGDGVDNLSDVCAAGDDNMDADGDGTADACDDTPNGDPQPEVSEETSVEETPAEEPAEEPAPEETTEEPTEDTSES